MHILSDISISNKKWAHEFGHILCVVADGVKLGPCAVVCNRSAMISNKRSTWISNGVTYVLDKKIF